MLEYDNQRGGKRSSKRNKASCIIPHGFNGNDETELDATGMDDLEKLWKSLCPEFGYKEDGVDYVERV